jgi:hypothetical protein
MDVVLKLGMRGPLVREAQGLINSYFGSIRLRPDSDFGPRTEAVVKEIQTSLKIKVDGIIGPRTWSVLRRRGQVTADPVGNGIDLFSLRDLEDFYRSLPARFGGPGVQPKASAPSSKLLNGAPAPSANGQSSARSASAQNIPKVVSVKDFRNFQRISFEGYAGRGYVIKDFRKFEGCGIRLLPTKEIREAGASLTGFKNECAQFVQYFGVPNTGTWRRGPRVCDFKPGELAAGTVVATLRDGKYYSDYSGRSHVGIYLSHTDYQQYLSGSDPNGAMRMMDQFNGNKITTRTYKYAVAADKEGSKSKKQWVDGSGKTRTNRVQWGKDGEEYYVLLTSE